MLPHRGGGAETYIDLLETMDGYVHERVPLASARTALAAGPSIATGYPGLVRRARAADLVHAHGDVAAVLALPLLRTRPSVWTTHGLHFLRRAPGPFGRAVAATIRATAQTICTSDAERDELRALVDSPKLVTVHNGIVLPARPSPQERSAAREQLGVDGVVALFLGQLEERKAPLVAVEAARAARAQGAPVVLLVAGDGPLAGEVAAAAGDAVRPLGFRDAVPTLLAAADVLVMPSEREGLSFAVLEAMGRGVAMLVSDGAGNPEAVGDAGVVVPTGDVAAFTRELVRLATDDAARTALGEAARERVARDFTAERLVAGVRAAYERA